jgi:hypothetical protein
LGVAAIAVDVDDPVTPSTDTRRAIDVMFMTIGVRQPTLELGADEYRAP